MQKTTTMKIAAGLLAAASVPPLCVYGAYRWAVWRGARPAPHTVSSIGVIGGADGPTAIFVAARMQMERYLALGAVPLAAAAGLFLWAQKRRQKERKEG